MKHRFKKTWPAFLACLALATASGPSRGQDVRQIPPDVMLILDTSGSMEYTRVTHAVPECNADPAKDDEANRTRWMMILDALLGPVENETYACERAYPGTTLTYWESGIDKMVSMTKPAEHVIPHFVALGTRDVPFGVLERYREFIRFGMATFDSYEEDETNGDGMWSYGPVMAGERNMGIKMEEGISGGVQEDFIPGALVSWGSDAENMDLINFRIRKELTQTMPYCGSPIAGALDDVEYFFVNDPDNKHPGNDGYDRYFNCRERFAILLTDGKPNTGEGTVYGTSPEEAADLWALSPKVPLYVIWMPTCPKDEVNPTSEWNKEKVILDEIANAGCPPSDVSCPAGAYPVENTADIMDSLEAILYRAMRNAKSRTVALTTNQVGTKATAGVVQYQFNTSFVPHEGEPWEGILERSSYFCNAADEVELLNADYLDYGESLDARAASRKLYTAVNAVAKLPGTALDDFETTNGAITPGVLGDASKDAAWVADVIDFMHGRGGSTRDPGNSADCLGNCHRLADPFHASAAMIGPPVSDLPFLSYYDYQTAKANRPPVVFLATNDGMVHAFRVQDTGNAAEKGEELWAYVPGALLPSVAHQVPIAHIWGVDSTPVAGDVRLFKDDDADSADETWKAILVGGYRQGAYGIYALDVTDPLAPKFLWEATPKKTGFGNLKETYASPLLGTVFTKHPTMAGNPTGEIAAVIFPAGFNPASREGSTGLFVVTADEGVILKELMPEFPASLACPASPDCSAHPECCAQLVTSPVGFAATAGYLTTRVFVGDDRGRIWRADLSSKDTGDWRLRLFYPVVKDTDSAPYTTGEAVESPVGLAMNDDGKLVVIFGTGNVDDLTGMGQNYVFSVTENIEYDGGTGTYYGKPELNWVIQLEAGEKLMGQPVIFNKAVYFATFVPYTNASDLCQFGAGRIWGVHYMSKDPDKDGDEADFAMLDETEPPDEEPPFVRYKQYFNTIISGLTVVQRPSCLGIDPMTGMPLNTGAQEVYEIVAQASGGQGVKEGQRKTPTITIRIPAPLSKNLADSWGSLLQ